MAIRMMPFTNGEKVYRFRVDLEGEFFRFNVKFNQREGFWYFDMLDDEGTRIISGKKIVIGFPLLRWLASRNRPLGEMFAYDTRSGGNEAGTDDLGTLIEVAYFEQATYAELAG